MSKLSRLALFTVFGVALALVVTPAQAAFPQGRSIILSDWAGTIQECVDFKTGQGPTYAADLLFAGKRCTASEVSVDHPEVGFNSFSMTCNNPPFFSFYSPKKVTMQCVCARRGTANYGLIIGGFGPATCTCAAEYLKTAFGTLSDALPGLTIFANIFGPDTCAGIFSAKDGASPTPGVRSRAQSR